MLRFSGGETIQGVLKKSEMRRHLKGKNATWNEEETWEYVVVCMFICMFAGGTHYPQQLQQYKFGPRHFDNTALS